MLAAAIITFREILEIALVVSIIMAATRGVVGRGLWISLGLGSGTVGAGIVAALAGALSTLFDGAGQDVFNAGVSFLAVLLIGSHIVWMSNHGKEMAINMRQVGQSVSQGTQHMSILATVVGLAMLREGSEIVLMLQGLWASSAGATTLLGAGLGLFGGVLAGSLMYLGFLALPLGRVFSVTNGILILIAAGMAARGANFLAQAGLLPSLGGKLWDTSGFISEQNPVGMLLSALVGYIAKPNGIEVLFYILTVSIVMSLIALTRRHPSKPHVA
jgi:high-affinity iron transporter